MFDDATRSAFVSASDTVPVLELRLPGTWRSIPLTNVAAAHAAVQRLVDESVGPADDRATLRRELRASLEGGLADAVAGEGRSFHVALEVAPGIPTPATIAVLEPALRLSPAIGVDATETGRVLEQVLRATRADAPASLERLEHARSAVVRLHRRTQQQVNIEGEPLAMPDGSPAPQTVDRLDAEYWMTVPGSKRVVLLHASTPLGALETEMLRLFDGIVRAARWTAG